MLSRAALWRGGLVALLAAVIWIAHHDRWTLASWSVPTDYSGDANETLARLQAAGEGDLVPFQSQVVERLGAPFGASWNAYPTPDKLLMLGLGLLAQVVGLFTAANVGLVLAQVSAALAFYFTARWLRCRWEWAAAGALLFAYTYHTFHRGLAHFSLLFTWTVPLGLLAVWLVAGSRRLAWNQPGAWLCLAAAFALGASNPYNLFFWLQLMGWAVVLQALGDRRPANLQVGITAVALALLTCIGLHLESWVHAEDTGAISVLTRNYSGTERYALKAVEMFIPPPFHSWDRLAFFGDRYARWSEWRGEPFLPYLGLVGIAGAAWLGWATLRAVVRRRNLPGQALAIGWILAYAALGGLTNLLALFAGFHLFRATNRAAIFISALVLCFLVVRLSRVTSGWPRAWRLAAAALVATIGIADQLPRREAGPDAASVARMVEADRAFGETLERELGPGAQVFQLPVLGFPEVETPHELADYEHFRPYLVTRTLRFSYGATKHRARSRWQRELAALPAPAAVRELEASGFAALYVDRQGFADGGEQLLQELRDLGYERVLSSPGGEQVVVPLRPVPHPQPPLARSLTAGRGWHPRPDRGVRWAHGRAYLSYFNPHPYPLVRDVRISLVGIAPRFVTLYHEGRPVRRAKVGARPTTVILPSHPLAPGINRFELHSEAPPIRAGEGTHRQLRTFGLLAATATPPTAPESESMPHPLAGSDAATMALPAAEQ